MKRLVVCTVSTESGQIIGWDDVSHLSESQRETYRWELETRGLRVHFNEEIRDKGVMR